MPSKILLVPWVTDLNQNGDNFGQYSTTGGGVMGADCHTGDNNKKNYNNNDDDHSSVGGGGGGTRGMATDDSSRVDNNHNKVQTYGSSRHLSSSAAWRGGTNKTTNGGDCSHGNYYSSHNSHHHQQQPQQQRKSTPVVFMCNMICRVPISGIYVASLVVECGLIEVLIDMIMGRLCNSNVLKKINTIGQRQTSWNHSNTTTATTTTATTATTMTPDEVEKIKKLTTIHDYDIEEWWSILTLFANIINISDKAKDRIERHVGIEYVIKFLLPIAQYGGHQQLNGGSTTSSHKGLINTLLSLCISGASLSPSSRPFIYCSRLNDDNNNHNNHNNHNNNDNNDNNDNNNDSNDNNDNDANNNDNNDNNDNDTSWLFQQYNDNYELMNTLISGIEETSLSLLSPAYMTNGRSISMMLSVLRPSIVRLENHYKQTGRYHYYHSSSSLYPNQYDNSHKKELFIDKKDNNDSNLNVSNRSFSQRQLFTSTHADMSYSYSSKFGNDHSSVGGDIAQMSDIDLNEYETRSIGGVTRSSYHSLHALGKNQTYIYIYILSLLSLSSSSLLLSLSLLLSSSLSL